MIDRRHFLSGSLAGALSLRAASTPSRIIDTHIHIYDPTRAEGVPWPPKDNALLYKPHLLDDFRAVTRGLGVTGVIVVEASAWLEDNQWVLDRAAKDSLVVGVVGNLAIADPAFDRNLERFSANKLFRGIRLSGNAFSATGPSLDHALRKLAAAGLSLDVVNAQSVLPAVAKAAMRVPDLRVVLDHLPFPEGTPLEEIAKNPKIYIKVSTVLQSKDGRVSEDLAVYRHSLDPLWELFGRDRLIYGSNWPVSNRLTPYGPVLKLVREYFVARGGEAEEAYFWKNAKAAYRYVDRT